MQSVCMYVSMWDEVPEEHVCVSGEIRRILVFHCGKDKQNVMWRDGGKESTERPENGGL